jgi:hypothetical protein
MLSLNSTTIKQAQAGFMMIIVIRDERAENNKRCKNVTDF